MTWLFRLVEIKTRFKNDFSARRSCTLGKERTSCSLRRLTERDSRLAHYFALFWGLGLRLGYLAISDAKSDIIFLLSDPDLLYG